MPIREKPRDFHCQVMVWSKDAPSGAFRRGYVIDCVKREKKLAIYESKQTFLRRKKEGHPKLQGKDYDSHMWVINLLGVGRNLAYRRFLEPLTRPASIVEPEYHAPDLEDRIIRLGERKWKFQFEPRHIKGFLDDGEIDLTRKKAEKLLVRTDGVEEKFSWLD